MATPLTADALVAVLRAEGVTVVEHPGWRINNRNHKGAWGPVNGVIIHHTVTSGTTATVELCFNGHADLPGPLCHGVIAKDGTVYLVGNGRANHAGSGDSDVLGSVINEEPLPAPNENDTDGNARFYGFECENLGDNVDVWPLVQVEAIIRASAALCRAHGWGQHGDTSVIGHKEWTNTKVDPRGPIQGGGSVSMNNIRTRVAERLRHPSSWNPSTEDDMALTDAQDKKLTELHARLVPYAGWSYKGEKNLDGTGPEIRDAYWYQRETKKEVDAVKAAVAEVNTKVDALATGGVDVNELAAQVADLLGNTLAAQVADLLAARMAD